MIRTITLGARGRAILSCGASLAALAGLSVPHAAMAQIATSPAVAEDAKPETAGDIVVTATRVIRDGYEAPTPTTVVGIEDIGKKAPSNLADLLNQMPAFSGSIMPTNVTAAVSQGLGGLNTLNLRNLGPNRTLVLLDGQRVAASTLNGWVDVNTFPQALIKRVDIVTGGASAGWGSDAVAGVVNFVLDKDFTGLKGEVQGGVTTHGDNRSYKVSLTGGTSFADGRGHILLSGEIAHSDGIDGVPRSWVNRIKLLGVNPGYAPGNGQPQYLTTFNGLATATPGGIITSGPAQGTYFGPGGTPLRFNYGTVSGNFMRGGDGAYPYDYAAQAADLAPELSRKNIFFRGSFDVTDHINIFAQASYARAHSNGNALSPPLFSFFTVDPTTNAFLPASVAAAAGTAPFRLGSFLQDYGVITATTTRETTRGVIGASGDFDAVGSNWTWSAYGQRTVNNILLSSYELNVAKLLAAVNAVRNPSTGAIQCAALATNPGCVPFNLFGTGVNSQAALNYVAGEAWGRNKLKQNVVAGNLHGNPISTWAGPVSVALGVEHRRESVSGTNDPVSSVRGWLGGNILASHGSYSVTEGYFEAVVPLAKDMPFAKALDFDGAVRLTDYSISGTAVTWKAGFTYSPIDDISFRFTRSRDIRAPNLAELFAAGVGGTSSGLVDTVRNLPTSIVSSVTSGTTNLQPEVADSLGLGVVLKPRFLPGFGASVDYYKVDIKDAIFTAPLQQQVNQCAQGSAQACAGIVRNAAGVITQVNVVPINLASQKNRGIDFELSYRQQVTAGSVLDGTLTLRGLATRFLKNKFNNGITPPTDNVGTNADALSGANMGTLPRWRFQGNISWEQGPLSLGLTVRSISSGKFNTSYVECTSGCPLSTTANPTIDDNHVAGATYFDANIGYKLADGIDAYAVVDNLFDKAPVVTAYGPTIGSAPLSVTPSLYDVLGRTFRFGVRFKM